MAFRFIQILTMYDANKLQQLSIAPIPKVDKSVNVDSKVDFFNPSFFLEVSVPSSEQFERSFCSSI